VQRIFNCNKLQDSSLTPDKARNILIYMERFSVPSLKELQFFQMIGFFFGSPVMCYVWISLFTRKSPVATKRNKL